MKAKKVYESLNILKPKSSEEVSDAFVNLPIIEQVQFLEDYENRTMIPFEKWPLILQIKEQLKNNKQFDGMFRVTSNDVMRQFVWSFQPDEEIGTKFKIYNRLSNNIPPINVEQHNEEPDAIHVYEEADTANEQIIESYDGFIKWLNDDYLWKREKFQIDP